MLPDKVIAIYCFWDDVLKAMGHKTKENCRTTDAEILTTALVSALLFKGNQSISIHYMRSHNMLPLVPKKTGFTKRLHNLAELLWTIFQQLGHLIKQLHVSHRYILDSFPLPVCQNIRMPHCKLLKGAVFRGFCASKQQYFFGVKVQVIVTEDGLPVEALFVPGAEHDAEALCPLLWDFEAGDAIYEDSRYTSYVFEDMAGETGIEVLRARKINSKRKDAPHVAYLKNHYRKRIETVFSTITNLFPKTLHCVSTKGFFIKALLFLMAYQFNKII